VDSCDTIYVTAAAHEQQLLAPLVAGLLTDLRHAVYGASWQDGCAPWPPVLLLLDECAKVAPIPDLPAMLSEAGSQGLEVICVFQDISQSPPPLAPRGGRVHVAVRRQDHPLLRRRPETLEQLSLLCGGWDCPVQTLSEQRPAGGRPVTPSPDAVIAR
jgi:type IV secretion system protein VirD4